MGGFAEDDVIGRLLDARVWVFVGLGGDSSREVWRQARLMHERGKVVVPVHPERESVFGQVAYASLDEVPGDVDVVGVYRRSEAAGAFVDQAVARGAKGVWLPLGVVDEDAGRRARDAGVDVVMDRCPAVEWARRR
ncbi:CoA-binding protein [Actinomadura flavalba]|uniref:CoA-binding protein n=1 Tax=Actinomadura flavalba TaxID=1120938 RepID=UPI00035F8448|nr:CoA-binding protein [Actinomadura flavalba]